MQDDQPVRKTVSLPASLWTRLSAYRHAEQHKTERDAIKRLLEDALRLYETERGLLLKAHEDL